LIYKRANGFDEYRQQASPPLIAKGMPTFVEATPLKEVQAFLRMGRDCQWPLYVTCATAVTATQTLAITYAISWEGMTSDDDGVVPVSWYWSKFKEQAALENLTCPPAYSRPGVKWGATVRKENNSIRVLLKEEGIWTPEDPGGPPPMILFGPKAIVKMRTTLKGEAALAEMSQSLGTLYQNRYTISEDVPSREWALVGSFGNGEVPIQFRLPQPQMEYSEVVAANLSILKSGLKTQNYDKGIDKFGRKFDPDEELSAAVAIHTRWQGDHGWAIAFKQGSRRCLLLGTVDGMRNDEVLWGALSTWAKFQPRLSSPRRFPGKLYYPDEASHVIEALWNHLDKLELSPGFCDRSPLCQAAMISFSEGLRSVDCTDWEPHPIAKAPGKLARIALEAAFSRVRPIADGPNQWDFHRSSGGTDGFTSQSIPIIGPESGPGTGLTGTCGSS
jgi:hypothetical protein